MKTSAFLSLLLALTSPLFAETRTEPPVPVRTVAPQYPEALRRDHVAGVVMIRIDVDAQGNVVDAAVESSTNPAFNTPAVDALKRWRFKPAQQNGSPIPAKLKVPIKFRDDSDV